MLAKVSELLYVERNNSWTNFSSERYINTLFETTRFTDDIQTRRFLNQIYATTLDVSFLHSGGIITVTNYMDLEKKAVL